ncbi:hypothetical protein ILUMI_13630 [Ignelater luminosus]|uniref:Uncharacterized protein n=1 Tax=Ignelater luminosus TaxID=2038154 RepID=A0A8K0G5M5_IGNLU|nr:hypothetical protein ILUMI_13630 [Ignelater luminosus]
MEGDEPYIVYSVLVSTIFAGGQLDLHFFQNDYHLIVERAEISYYNKIYMKTASVVSFRYNRTTIAVNLTLRFNIDVGANLEVKFASNEYRDFPLRFGDTVCRALDADLSGIKQMIAKCGNMSDCTFFKDRTYHVCNTVPDESKLPPYMPSGRYMLEIEMSYRSMKLFAWKIYLAITRPEVKRYE